MKVNPRVKVWLEADGKNLIGKGGAAILRNVLVEGSIRRAAEKLGISYKYAWNYLRKIEDRLGEKVVESVRGGKEKGKTVLTQTGRLLLSKYSRFERFLNNALSNPEMWEACGLSIPDRNVVPGWVKSVEVDGPAAMVSVGVNQSFKLVSVISSRSVEDLNLKVGDKVTVIVKATEVMVSKEEKL